MTPTSSSLFSRAVLAIALLVGFYVMALGIVLGLLWLPFAEVMFTDRVHVKLALFCVVAAVMILWSIVPRIDRFVNPGPTLTQTDHPRLFDVLREVSEQTGQAMPSEVFLVHDMNAWVSERGGIMGLGSRRVMGLGLPLMQVLTVSELRAVLAHEFGHFHGGDTKLGPWIYKTRSAIGRTVEALDGGGIGMLSLVQVPFVAYSKMFLRVTHAISRSQEFGADALAARTQGSAALGNGLRKIHGAALAFQPYFGSEVIPALQAGFHPPIAQGFGEFIRSPAIAKAIDRAVADAMENDETDLYDTHPALKDRLAAIADIPPGDVLDPLPSLSLLDDVVGAERALLEAILIEELSNKLQPIDWSAVGAQVFAPSWKAQAEEHGPGFTALTPASLPTKDAALVALVRQSVPAAAEAPDEDVLGFGQNLLGAMLATALIRKGWALSAEPGAPVVLSKAGHSLQPFAVFSQLSEGELTLESWQGLLSDSGIATLPLDVVD